MCLMLTYVHICICMYGLFCITFFGLSLLCSVWVKYVDLALSVENYEALDMCFF